MVSSLHSTERQVPVWNKAVISHCTEGILLSSYNSCCTLLTLCEMVDYVICDYVINKPELSVYPATAILVVWNDLTETSAAISLDYHTKPTEKADFL